MLAPKKTHSLSISNLCLIFNINIPEAGQAVPPMPWQGTLSTLCCVWRGLYNIAEDAALGAGDPGSPRGWVRMGIGQYDACRSLALPLGLNHPAPPSPGHSPAIPTSPLHS